MDFNRPVALHVETRRPNLGRGVGGFGPFVVGTLATGYGFSVAIGLLAVIYLIDIAATLTLIPERKGAALE